MEFRKIISCILSCFFFRMSKKREQDANVTTFRLREEDGNVTPAWNATLNRDRELELESERCWLLPLYECNVTGTQNKIREPP